MLTRIIVGIIGIILAAFVIETGGIVFAAFTLVLAIIGWFEYASALAKKGANITLTAGILFLILILCCAFWGNAEEIIGVVSAALLAVMSAAVLLRSRVDFVDSCYSAAGMFYIGIPFAHLIMLRELDGAAVETSLGMFPFGCAMVWVMFIGTWASDTFAYFVGSAIGRHKLCPNISPNKTVEGFVGSLVGTSASVAALGAFFSFPVVTMAILGFFTAIFATVGDLVESVLKRHAGIKDSGRLIPGHGGVLDRFDSVLFTAPFVYYFAVLLLIAEV